MRKLLIAALALGVVCLVKPVLATPAFFVASAARLSQAERAMVQKADDRSPETKSDRSADDRGQDYYGRNPTWRDTRPWSDDEWRRDPGMEENAPDTDDND
jgi:hypothetical protein